MKRRSWVSNLARTIIAIRPTVTAEAGSSVAATSNWVICLRLPFRPTRASALVTARSRTTREGGRGRQSCAVTGLGWLDDHRAADRRGSGISVLASCGARERVVCAVRVTRRCRLSPCVFLGSGVRMVTAGDGDALREAGLVTGFTAALPGRRAPRRWPGEMAGSRAVGTRIRTLLTCGNASTRLSRTGSGDPGSPVTLHRRPESPQRAHESLPRVHPISQPPPGALRRPGDGHRSETGSR